jgi:hypothetical protein
MVCHYDLIVPFRAGIGTLHLQVAGRSKGQFPHASLHEYVANNHTKEDGGCQAKRGKKLHSATPMAHHSPRPINPKKIQGHKNNFYLTIQAV